MSSKSSGASNPIDPQVNRTLNEVAFTYDILLYFLRSKKQGEQRGRAKPGVEPGRPHLVFDEIAPFLPYAATM